MDGLDSMTTEELEAEIERRKEAVPKMLRDKDRDCAGSQKYLLDLCERYITEIFNVGRPSEDLEHFIFERAMEWAYGSDIWVWINDRENCRR